MSGPERKTQVITGIAPDAIPYADLMAEQKPAIVKGVLRDLPLVRAGQRSPAEAVEYLKSFYGGRPVVGSTGAPESRGRYFYNADVTGLNFDASRVALDEYLDRMLAHLEDAAPPAFYVGSADAEHSLPGLRERDGPVLHEPVVD